ncbi:MAG: ABC transporter substrate-binding protein [Anaerolineae bacterium]
MNSYTSDDRWALRIRTGILEALARSGYSVADDTLSWGTYHLEASGIGDSAESMRRLNEVTEVIRILQPEIVIVSDDEAFQLMMPTYSDPEVRFVYCGVGATAESMSSLPDNVFGVREPVPAVETLSMGRSLTGDEGRYLLIGDGSITGQIVTARAYNELAREASDGATPFLGVAGSWEEWTTLVQSRSGEVDFIIVTSYQPLIDAQGEVVTGQAMMAWMLSNVSVPVFSLSETLVIDGAVGGLVSDAYKQGQAAGQIAARLAQHGGVEADSPLVGSGSRLVLNAAAARHWGLRIPALFPIAAEVYLSLPVGYGGQPDA